MNRYLLNNYINFIPFYLKRHYPALLIFSITDQCNANCKICFNRTRYFSEPKLNLKEIELISKNSGWIPFLSITGGEPFLLDNLGMIIEFFYKNNHSNHININTNGSFPIKTYNLVKSFIKKYPDSILRVEVSLDGLEKQHDEIRKTEGLFNNTVRTLELLYELKNNYNNFIPEVITVLSKYNQDFIFKIIRYIEDKFNLNHIILFPRATEDEGANISIKLYQEIIEYFYHRKRYGSYIYNLLNRMRHKMILDKLRNNVYYRCVGGREIIVLNSDGTVEPCEMFREKTNFYKIGNIRNFNYNIKLLLKSEIAREIRKYIIQSNCKCSFETGITASIIFRPQVLIKYWLKTLL